MKFNWFLKKVELREPTSTLSWDARPFVLHIINNLDVGGAERFLVQLLHEQARLGWRTGVITLTDLNPGARDLYGSGVLFRSCGRTRLNDPRLLFDLMSQLSRLRPDVVHTHLFYADTFGRLAAWLQGMRAIVSTEHSTEAWALSAKRRLAMRWTHRLARHVVAVSEAVRQAAAARLHVDPSSLEVIPNGIDLTAWEGMKPCARSVLELSEEDFVVGCVGRMVESKGYDVLMRAAARLVEEDPASVATLRLLMIGDGPERGALQQLAAQLGLQSAVRWLGMRRDVPELLLMLDVFAMPSAYEGHSMALLEAMAAGCACLVSDIPEIAGTVGDAAWRVPPGDVTALAEGLGALRCDPERRSKLGTAARQAVQAYSIVAAAKRYLSLYVEERGSPRR